MATLEYNEHKSKSKRNYTRNSILDEQIALKIKENDTNFDDIRFKEWAKETFIEYQNAWNKKDMNLVRSRLDRNLCEHYQLLLKANRDEKTTNIVEVKQINYIDFSAYNTDNEKEIIEVALNAVLYDYTVDETQKIIEGSNTIKSRITYKMLFYRKVGTKTNEEKKESFCPNCGARIDGVQNKCEFCNSEILNNVRAWILNSIEKY